MVSVANADFTGNYKHATTPRIDPAYPSSARPTGAWQLPTGYYEPSKMPLTIVSPQPDVVGDDKYAWRHGLYNREFRIAIGVQGGAYPFKFELLQGPAGATIGEELDRTVVGSFVRHTRSADYGVVSYPNAAAGTHTFQVRVTDQEGTTATVLWTTTVTVGDPMYAFLDESTPVSNAAATEAQPLKAWSDLWQDDNTNNDYAGKILALKAGTYNVYGDLSIPNALLDRDVKPFGIVGVEAGCFLDLSQGHLNNNGVGVCDGFFMMGFKFTGARPSAEVPNPRLFTPGQSDDIYIYNVEWDNSGAFPSSTDNPCCIFLSDNATPRSRITVIGCTVNDMDFQLVCSFAVDYLVAENNTATTLFTPTAGNGSCFINVKDDNRYTSVRANNFYGSTNNTAYFIQNQGVTNRDIEVCYNLGLVTYTGGTADADGVIEVNGQNGFISNCTASRNTFSGTGLRAGRFNPNGVDPAELTALSSNVYATDRAADFTANSTGNYTDSGSKSVAVTDLDGNGDLVGAALAAHDGQSGRWVWSPNS